MGLKGGVWLRRELREEERKMTEDQYKEFGGNAVELGGRKGGVKTNRTRRIE